MTERHETEHKTFDDPEEVREFPNGRAEILIVGGAEVGRLVFQPGWRWSTDVKPIAGTESCEAPHFQYHVSGRLGIRMDDGTEFEVGPATCLAAQRPRRLGDRRRARRRRRLVRRQHLRQGRLSRRGPADPRPAGVAARARVRTLRVICSIWGSRPARPWAQSVEPDVTTVAPAVVRVGAEHGVAVADALHRLGVPGAEHPGGDVLQLARLARLRRTGGGLPGEVLGRAGAEDLEGRRRAVLAGRVRQAVR